MPERHVRVCDELCGLVEDAGPYGLLDAEVGAGVGELVRGGGGGFADMHGDDAGFVGRAGLGDDLDELVVVAVTVDEHELRVEPFGRLKRLVGFGGASDACELRVLVHAVDGRLAPRSPLTTSWARISRKSRELQSSAAPMVRLAVASRSLTIAARQRWRARLRCGA